MVKSGILVLPLVIFILLRCKNARGVAAQVENRPFFFLLLARNISLLISLEMNGCSAFSARRNIAKRWVWCSGSFLHLIKRRDLIKIHVRSSVQCLTFLRVTLRSLLLPLSVTPLFCLAHPFSNSDKFSNSIISSIKLIIRQPLFLCLSILADIRDPC